MKTWHIVLAALIIGVLLGGAIAGFELRLYPWDGSPEGTAGTGFDPDPTALRPRAVVPVEEFDFGVMDSEREADHEFVIRNRGEAVLSLTKGESSCKCTVADIGAAELQPGEETTVKVHWHTRNFHGTFHQSVTVNTSDRQHERLRFSIKGLVTGSVKATPADITSNNIPAGLGRSFDVMLHTFKPGALKIEGVEYSDKSLADHFEVHFEPMTPQQIAGETAAVGGTVARVTVKPGLPLGPIQQTITLQTNLVDKPRLDIPFKGTVVSDISIDAPGWDRDTGTLLLGTFTTNDSVERIVRIKAGGRHAKAAHFTIEEVQPEQLKATILTERETEEAGRLEKHAVLRIWVPAGSRAGNFLGSETTEAGKIVLKTGDPEAPILKMTVKFAVRQAEP